MITVYGYWQSSATWRVRLCLLLKNLSFDYQPVNLLAGEQSETDHLARNPQGLVPALKTDNGHIITQSLSIIHYLERRYTTKPIIPKDPIQAARAETIATMIACEAQPFGNRKVLQYLKNDLNFDDTAIKDWMNRWAGQTLKAVERLVDQKENHFCVGNTPTLADIFVIPQLYAARRFGADIDGLSRLLRIEKKCEQLEIFHQAHPFQQSDRSI